MERSLIVSAILLGSATPLFGQEAQKTYPLSFSGYVEAYYIQDFNNPSDNRRPGFVYSHNRSDEASINMALLKLDYDEERVRASLGVAAGTYMKANYAVEPGALNKIFEANVGLKISERHDLWVDVGVLPSHIGFESAIGKDNWTLTRSMLADNSPYFETGAQVSYTSADGKWFVSGLVLNGWQRIQRPDGNTTPSFGHQLTYKPSERVKLNSSSFIGNDKSDEHRQMRYFHNFYAKFQLNCEWSLTAAFDVGAEQEEKGSSRYNTWFSPIVIARYAPSEKWSVAARGEYYQDRHGVIVETDALKGFRMFGYSINVDYNILPNVLLRAEVRRFDGKDAVFAKGEDAFTANNLMVVTALAINF